jgi:hypothetical protein
MATATRPDEPGVLTGPAHDLPSGSADAVDLPVAIPVAPEIDPLVPVSNRERSSLSGEAGRPETGTAGSPSPLAQPASVSGTARI